MTTIVSATALVTCFLLLAGMARGEAPTTGPATTQPVSVLDFTVRDNAGDDVDLNRYRGKVLLIVNVASKCGHTKQYTGLEKLYQQQKERGLAILAFPANDFGGQEPGTDAEIRAFCSTNYQVSFDLFSKIAAKGEAQAPLYRFLTDPQTNPQFSGEIKWNFTKFLISRTGEIVRRFEPKVTPEDPELVAAIDAELAKPTE